MSITVETAKEHLNDKAVFCCRAEEGIVISPENLEDPGLFDDLVDSGLLSFPDDALTIGQVLGAKLLKTKTTGNKPPPAVKRGSIVSILPLISSVKTLTLASNSLVWYSVTLTSVVSTLIVF